MDDYRAMKKRHQEEVNAFPMRFAFNQHQFKKGMRELGLEPTDTDKIYGLPGTGGFYRKTDAPAFRELLDRHEKEMQAAIDGDPTGDGFIYQMFDEELADHEYSYTRDFESTLDALQMTVEEICADPRLLHGLRKAAEHQRG